MPIIICPRCRNRLVVAQGNTDVVHACNSGDNARDQEDVPVMGSYDDEGGTADVPKHQVMMAGIQNTLAGTDAALEGANEDPRGDRGRRTTTTRTRPHNEYIELKK